MSAGMGNVLGHLGYYTPQGDVPGGGDKKMEGPGVNASEDEVPVFCAKYQNAEDKAAEDRAAEGPKVIVYYPRRAYRDNSPGRLEQYHMSSVLLSLENIREDIKSGGTVLTYTDRELKTTEMGVITSLGRQGAAAPEDCTPDDLTPDHRFRYYRNGWSLVRRLGWCLRSDRELCTATIQGIYDDLVEEDLSTTLRSFMGVLDHELSAVDPYLATKNRALRLQFIALGEEWFTALKESPELADYLEAESQETNLEAVLF